MTHGIEDVLESRGIIIDHLLENRSNSTHDEANTSGDVVINADTVIICDDIDQLVEGLKQNTGE